MIRDLLLDLRATWRKHIWWPLRHPNRTPPGVRFIYIETITLNQDDTDLREELEADGWEEYGMDQRLPLDDRLGRVRYIRYTPLREDT